MPVQNFGPKAEKAKVTAFIQELHIAHQALMRAHAGGVPPGLCDDEGPVDWHTSVGVRGGFKRYVQAPNLAVFMIQFDDSHVCSNGLKLNHQVVI